MTAGHLFLKFCVYILKWKSFDDSTLRDIDEIINWFIDHILNFLDWLWGGGGGEGLRVSIFVIMGGYYFPEISFARSLAGLSMSKMQVRMKELFIKES